MLGLIARFVLALFRSGTDLAAESLALCQQLIALQRSVKRPKTVVVVSGTRASWRRMQLPGTPKGGTVGKGRPACPALPNGADASDDLTSRGFVSKTPESGLRCFQEAPPSTKNGREDKMSTVHNHRSIGGIGVLALLAVLTASPSNALAQEPPPERLLLRGVVRDFGERDAPGGHPDFEPPMNEFGGRVSGNVALTLSADGKPVFTGAGRKVASQWRDADGRQICYALYDADRGDSNGSWSDPSTAGITSEESFNQWYRDVLGVNLSKTLTITLVREFSGTYVFDDRDDPLYRDRGGFFPIDDQLFGNSGDSPDHNFHFTFELHTEFTYDAAGVQHFMFSGDDDVWVYIDGRLVTDLGGVHAAHDQYVDLDRLGLVDGQRYSLDFFFTERHRTHSNFRIETNLILESVNVPPVTYAYD